MKIKKIIMRCIFVITVIFFAYTLGYLFFQPFGESKGLALLFSLIIFIIFFHKEIILLGLGAKKSYFKWSPQSRIYSSGFIRSDCIAIKPYGKLCLIFSDDLSINKRKELHRAVIDGSLRIHSFYEVLTTSFFYLSLKPLSMLINHSSFFRPFLSEFLYYFINPCLEFALGKNKERRRSGKIRSNFCEEILCFSSINDGNTNLVRAIKNSL